MVLVALSFGIFSRGGGKGVGKGVDESCGHDVGEQLRSLCGGHWLGR